MATKLATNIARPKQNLLIAKNKQIYYLKYLSNLIGERINT